MKCKLTDINKVRDLNLRFEIKKVRDLNPRFEINKGRDLNPRFKINDLTIYRKNISNVYSAKILLPGVSRSKN